MKVGSLVKLIREVGEKEFDEEILPRIGPIYTVREIIGKRWKYIKLEEIVNPIFNYDGDIGEAEFAMWAFKEILPPIENIEEHVNKNTLERVLK